MSERRSELLEKAIGKLTSLPLEDQDRYASEILADLDDEAAWNRSFATEASQKWLTAQAEKVLSEDLQGKLIPFDCDPAKA